MALFEAAFVFFFSCFDHHKLTNYCFNVCFNCISVVPHSLASANHLETFGRFDTLQIYTTVLSPHHHHYHHHHRLQSPSCPICKCMYVYALYTRPNSLRVHFCSLILKSNYYSTDYVNRRRMNRMHELCTVLSILFIFFCRLYCSHCTGLISLFSLMDGNIYFYSCNVPLVEITKSNYKILKVYELEN